LTRRFDLLLRILVPITIGILGFFADFIATLFNPNYINGYTITWQIFLIFLMYESCLWLTAQLDLKISWETHFVHRGMIQIGLGLLVGVTVFFVCSYGFKWIAIHLYQQNDVIREKHIIGWTLNGLLYAVPIVFIQLALIFINRWHHANMALKDYETQSHKSHVEALRHQINPHFLFNNLNALHSLIYENQELAQEFVEHMASVYRYILNHRNEELVPLEDELTMVDHFRYLLHTRYGPNLEIRFEVLQDSCEFFIAPLALYMLVENAVKHNEISQEKRLLVEITVIHTNLVVRNNINSKITTFSSTKLGLKNLEKRYHYLSNTPIDIEKSEGFFEVKLPLLKVVQ